MIAVNGSCREIAHPFRSGGAQFGGVVAQYWIARGIRGDGGEDMAGAGKGRGERTREEQGFHALIREGAGAVGAAGGADDDPALWKQEAGERLRRVAVTNGEERFHGATISRQKAMRKLLQSLHLRKAPGFGLDA